MPRASAITAWFLSVLLALAAAAGCTRPPATAGQPPVVLIGVDGATWDLLDGMIERGLLPNLARLRREGASGRLQSIRPTLSPVVWTSIATGKVAAKHGITGFLSTAAGGDGAEHPVTRTERRVKALWNILGETGMDVAVVGWFVTWPATEVAGRLVSDRAHFGAISHRTFPPAYLTTLAPVSQEEAVEALPRFMDFHYDPLAIAAAAEGDEPKSLDYLVFDRFVRAYTRDLFYLRAARAVLDDGRLPDFFALYLRGTDDVQHGFWKYMDPEPFGDVPAELQGRFGEVIDRYWQWTDAAIGEIVSRFGPDALIVVVSDHGAGPAVGKYRVIVPEHLHLSGAHRDQGILVVRGPGVRRGARIDGAGVLDVTPTILHYLGLPVAADMDGRVLGELFVPGFRSRTVDMIPTYEDQEPGGEVTEAEGTATPATTVPNQAETDARIVEHLRSLGYLR